MSPPTQSDPAGKNAKRDTSCAGVSGQTATAAALGRPLVGLFLWSLPLVLALLHFQATAFVALGVLAAVAFAATLRPVADHLWGPSSVRAVISVLLLLVVVAGLLSLLGWAAYGPIRRNIEQLPQLRDRVNEGLRHLVDWSGVTAEVTVSGLAESAGRVLTGRSLADRLSKVANELLTALLAILVVVIAAIYLLARSPGTLAGVAVKLLPPSHQEPTLRAVEQLQPQLRWWAIGTLCSMALIGTVFGLGFWVLDLEFTLPLALFAALAQAVPTFGPLVTLLLALLVAATQGLAEVIGVVVLYLLVQSLESYVLTPLVMRKAVQIPPVVTLFTIILWGNVFGLAGLILAIPIDLTIWAFLRQHLIEKHERMAQPARSEPP